MNTHKLFASLLLLIVGLCLGGCASTPKDESSEDRVSTLPWNKPASWERSMPGVGASY